MDRYERRRKIQRYERRRNPEPASMLVLGVGSLVVYGMGKEGRLPGVLQGAMASLAPSTFPPTQGGPSNTQSQSDRGKPAPPARVDIPYQPATVNPPPVSDLGPAGGYLSALWPTIRQVSTDSGSPIIPSIHLLHKGEGGHIILGVQIFTAMEFLFWRNRLAGDFRETSFDPGNDSEWTIYDIDLPSIDRPNVSATGADGTVWLDAFGYALTSESYRYCGGDPQNCNLLTSQWANHALLYQAGIWQW